MIHIRRCLMFSAVMLLTHCGASPDGNSNPVPDAGQIPDAGTPTPTAPGWSRAPAASLGRGRVGPGCSKRQALRDRWVRHSARVPGLRHRLRHLDDGLRPGGNGQRGRGRRGRGSFYVFGGEATPVVQVFDLAQAQWSAGPDLPESQVLPLGRGAGGFRGAPGRRVELRFGATTRRSPATPPSTCRAARTRRGRSRRCSPPGTTPTRE